MLEIKYITHNDKAIQAYFGELNNFGIDDVAWRYVQVVASKLPTHLYINVGLFRSECYPYDRHKTPFIFENGEIRCLTSVGYLKVEIKPLDSKFGPIMIGRPEDLMRYEVDEIFEQEVLND